ncbi:FAD-dependent monooxygenase [Labrenzia sp. 011]|uniref:FAD-dependent monooxygenase n=1 Tax=Labrenzia sp. 011 TaxID=2171494 RepID=UPI000D50CE7B|nr:FAD-dependent monooxygenase [Labrenzia sp. 011]PVB60002.1 salicylate hydroxylase [Labrenzia sp. 011]
MTRTGAAHQPIVIAGAGIGGLAAALALRQQGHEIVLMDKANALSEVGAGLQLSPNACSVLDRLGVLEALRPHVYAPDYLRIWSGKSGRQLGRVRFGDFLRQRHGFPFWVIHRADLQRVLLEQVEQTPGIAVRLATEVLDLEPTPYDHLSCVYRNNETTGNLSCRALVGADGVWSRSRRLVPGHENAVFSGQVAYRATIPLEAAPERWRKDSGLWMHRDSHLVHYPVRGGRELNIVALAAEAWQDETWSTKTDTKSVLHVFRDWPAEVRTLLAQPDGWLKWALCSVDASGPWSHGHVTLMGDAAHAMLPYMAQGAAMAIEDAAVLGKHLPPDVTNIPAALRAFERERKSRVRHIQGIASRNAKVFHFSGVMALARDTVLNLSSPETLTARFDDVYGWTAGNGNR